MDKIRKDKKTKKYYVKFPSEVIELYDFEGPIDGAIYLLEDLRNKMINCYISVSGWGEYQNLEVSGEREATPEEIEKYEAKLKKERARKREERKLLQEAQQRAEEAANQAALERVRKAFPDLIKE